MILHNDPLFAISFGDKKHSFEQNAFHHVECGEELLRQKPFLLLSKKLKLKKLIVPKQVHGTSGIIIKNPDDVLNVRPYQEADFVTTNISNIGIGVATADCLPIIFYDSFTHSIAVTHAGWRGSIKNIAIETVRTMGKEFGTRPESLRVFFGPCAKVCSYKVTKDFKKNLVPFPFKEKIIIKKNGAIYFNLPMFNQLLLETIGIKPAAFHLDYNLCTISNKSFCSYRRDGERAKRQMTIAVLK